MSEGSQAAQPPGDGPETVATADHESRHASLLADLHARPAPALHGPATVSFVAYLDGERTQADGRAGAGRSRRSHGGDRVVVEHHHEFVSFTATVPGVQQVLFSTDRNPFSGPSPDDGLAVSVQVEVVPLPSQESGVVSLAAEHLVADGMLLAWVAEELIVVGVDFRVTDDGPMRMLVMTSPSVGPGRVGRVVRRLLELETYRALSTLALEHAQQLARVLSDLEPRLVRLVERMDDASVSADETLEELLQVSAELETLASRHDFRFAAAHAYEAIVVDRLAVLRESRFGGRQLLAEFLALRFTPAMRTISSAEQRLHRLIARAGRAGDLLRTRVEVSHSAQNAAMLVSLDQRAQAQLRLQHAVEGLSVFAVTYYAVSILGYLLAPAAGALGVDEAVVKALLVPMVLLTVWLGVRRVRHGQGH